MNIKEKIKSLVTTAFLIICSNSYGQVEFPNFKGPYMGQKPPAPDMPAKLFAPGIISKETWDLEGVFAPGMKEFYFTTNHANPIIIGFRQENNVWKKFTEFPRTGEIVFSPDGNRMHMASGYKDRIADGWSESKSLGKPYEDMPIMRLSSSSKQTYFFDEATREGNGSIRYSRLINGKREQPKLLSQEINTGKWTAHPFIAADESYLIWDSEREGGFGKPDLYISFKQEDGSWGKAINMGPKVNSDKEDFFATVTPDGKYIMFNRTISWEPLNVDIYWVDAQIIEDLRPKKNENLAPEASAADVKLSNWDVPYLKNAFLDATPANRKDGIPVGKLGVDGGNKGMIIKLAQEIADSKEYKFDSLLIAHKGKLLFESYYKRGRINLPHYQASATKAYTSLALGRAIQLGYLSMTDLDKPLIGFFKDLDPTKFVGGTEKITLHQALTMRSGINISREQLEEFRKNPKRLKGQAQVQTYLEHSSPISSESQSFEYKAVDPRLVMQVLDAVVPGTAKDFIKSELLDKMGITEYGWKDDISGLPQAPHSASMTSRDMIKWGTLAMNKGKWNGEQLIPEAFIAKASSRILYTGDDDIPWGGKDVANQGYGYYWWSVDMNVGNKRYSSVSARGGYGQIIMFIKELDLLIVTTAHDNVTSYLQIITERILPAFIK